jgi:hypothetical protein
MITERKYHKKLGIQQLYSDLMDDHPKQNAFKYDKTTGNVPQAQVLPTHYPTQYQKRNGSGTRRNSTGTCTLSSSEV